MKAPSPLLGFNNNVRHRGRVFHVQTEDSGVRHPHIITHLFADGGRILKTTKTSYAEHVGQPTMAETVRQMMQDQHKAMVVALRDGLYDALLEDAPPPQSTLGSLPGRSSVTGLAASRPSTPGVAAPSSTVQSAAPPTVAAPPPVVAPPAPAITAPAQPTAPQPPIAQPPIAQPPSSQRGPSSQRVILPRPSVGTMPAVQIPAPAAPTAPPIAKAPAPIIPPAPIAPIAPTAPTIVEPPAVRGLSIQPPTITNEPSQDTLTGPLSRRRPNPRPRLDIDPAAIHTRESIPPARNVTIGGEAADASIDLDLGLGATAGSPIVPPELRSYPEPRPHASGPPPLPPAARVPPPLPPLPAPPPVVLPAPSVVARYVPPRPAAIFATSRPPPEGGSIFGEDLISEKSLDEVILGYLAEDLEAPEKK